MMGDLAKPNRIVRPETNPVDPNSRSNLTIVVEPPEDHELFSGASSHCWAIDRIPAANGMTLSENSTTMAIAAQTKTMARIWRVRIDR